VARGEGAQRVEARGRRLDRDVVVLRLIRQRHEAVKFWGGRSSFGTLSQSEPSWWLDENKNPASLSFPGLAKGDNNSYGFVMVIGSIRGFNRAVPFVPYEIHTVSGERYTVPHPDFISISPRGSFVVIIDAKDRPHHLSAILIERASPLNGHHRRKAGKRSSH